jgi:hypothetical protein
MDVRPEVSAIVSATARMGGPLAMLRDVLERRARSGAGLSPAEVRAALRLIAAERHQVVALPTVALDGTGASSVVPYGGDVGVARVRDMTGALAGP